MRTLHLPPISELIDMLVFYVIVVPILVISIIAVVIFVTG